MQCFKCNGRGHYAYDCPSKRLIIIKDNGEYSSESETESLHDVGNSETEPIVLECKEGSFLMVRRMLGSQIMPLDNSQRDNIFHARCNVKGRLCSLIIDGGSCTNVASTTLVSKLKLETKPHPKPYKLQWLSDDGETMVQEQVEVGITIGQYVDTVLCDVVPMEASHVLLGRPWQYDMRAIHDGFSNCISFSQKGKKFLLKPLTPKEVSEDTKRMRETRLGEWSDKRKSKDGNKETNKMSAEGEKSNTKLSEETKEGETQTKTICFSRKCEARNSLLIRKSFLENDNCFDENQVFEKDSLSSEFALQANMTFQDLEDRHSKEAPIVVVCAKDTSPKEPMELNTNELSLGKEIHNSDLSLIDYPSLFVDNKSLDLRTNLLQEGGYDEDIKRTQLLNGLKNSKIKKTNEDSNPKGAISRTIALMKDQSLILKDQPLIYPSKVNSNGVMKIEGFYKIYSGGGGYPTI